MGWLRDLMAQADPPLRSYGELARQVLAHSTWPDQTPPQPRSLAALFSKLDREQELEWLADRPTVQAAIAELTQSPVGHLAAVLQRYQSVTQPDGMFRLQDIPYAKALDLAREPLCPGLPPEMSLPALWHYTWWFAPEGSGRNLVEAWLGARGLCQVVNTQNLPNGAPCQLAAHGPVLLSLGKAAEPFAWEHHLTPNICVAAPFLPDQVGRREPGAKPVFAGLPWKVIRSPAPEQYAEQLVEWLARRLPDDGRFERDSVLAWLLAVPLKQGLVESLGTLLGLCGALDELGIRGRPPDSLIKLATAYFEFRLDRALPQDSGAVSWLRRQGIGVVLDICARLLVEGSDPWQKPRSFDDWVRVVPSEHQQTADLDWMRLALSDQNSPVRPGDISRAAKRLPPGAFRVVNALTQARLLMQDQQGLLGLRPHWFAATLTRAARKRLLDASALEWGEVLLNPHEAEDMLTGLLQRAQSHDMGALEAALEVETEDDPAGTAALEASFVVAGLSLLIGVELSQDLLDNLWDEQLRLVLELPGELPSARLLFGGPPRAERTGFFTSGLFHLAALAIAEQLPEGSGRRHASLRPWSQNEPSRDLNRLYDSILSVLNLACVTELTPAIIAMVDRLRTSIGQANEEPHPLECPGVMLDEIEHDVLALQLAEQLERVPRGLGVLKELAEQRGMRWSRVAEALWQSWLEAGQPRPEPWFLKPDLDQAALVWGAIPKQLLEQLIEQPTAKTVPFEHFQAAQWDVFVETWSASRLAVESDAAWWHIPRGVVADCITNDCLGFSDGVLNCLWQRFPSLLHARVRECLTEARHSAAFQLMAGAPAEHTSELVALLHEHVTVPQLKSAALDLLRRWLCERAKNRDPGWRDAYHLLCDIEEMLARVRI